ncbi:MAG TPA: hypothetical protein PKA58_15525 [Polyangium sp.]|nr:hypothetical protein [Polyangium sp.]
MIAVSTRVTYEYFTIILADIIAHSSADRGRTIDALGRVGHRIACSIARCGTITNNAGVTEAALVEYRLKGFGRCMRYIFTNDHMLTSARVLKRCEIAWFGAERTDRKTITRKATQGCWTGGGFKLVVFGQRRLAATIFHTLDRSVAIAMRVRGHAVAQGTFFRGTTPHADGNAEAEGGGERSSDIFQGTNHEHFLLMEKSDECISDCVAKARAITSK